MSAAPAILTVVDTNILVPALYLYTPISHFLNEGNIILIWNKFIYNEYSEIIYRLAPMSKKAGVRPEEAIELLELYAFMGHKTSDMPANFRKISHDRDDDNFLYAAHSGGADYIISDDTHLLQLRSFANIPIGKPKSFFDWAKAKHPM
jgi:putative PIN family toxin of toxin-antitoxin system